MGEMICRPAIRDISMRSSEFSLISTFESILKDTLSEGVLGIGDDAAVLSDSQGGSLVLCTDSLVEEVHFSANHLSSFDLGWKSLAVTLSDIAAMGAKPLSALVSVNLPAEMNFSIEDVYRGVKECASKFDVPVVGGDTVSSKEFVIVTTLLGRSDSKVLLRSGAEVGQTLWVSGVLGLANLGLRSFSDTSFPEKFSTRLEEFRSALRRPFPAIKLGAELAQKNLATAAIDISDGFLQDARHLALASKVDLLIKQDNVPVADAGKLGMQAAFAGGDDYLLLFTTPAENHSMLKENAERMGIYQVGEVIEGRGELVIENSVGKRMSATEFMSSLGVDSAGYQHFS